MTSITTSLKNTWRWIVIYWHRQSYSWSKIRKSEDVYEELFNHEHLFGFSNYLKDSKLFDPTNKKAIGKMKDESEGKIIGEFVGLKSKMYSMKNIDGKESNTAKGVNIATEFNEFKDTLFNNKIGKKCKMGT